VGYGRMYRDMAASIFLLGFPLVCYLLGAEVDSSLWVFWFYWSRRPVFHRDLVGKEKAKLEGINVIWFQWPGKTHAWLERLKAETAKTEVN